jgi:MoaA/NifB/PqqE/SkfB family radical SAM enzyme
MNASHRKPGLKALQLVAAWKSILTGSSPMLSIEVTRECPLKCPGCYAYGDGHLGGSVTLRGLADYRGEELVQRLIALVRQHHPLHVSLVGGEPLVRHRELSRVLPVLSAMGVHTMVVTSAVIPIPSEWMSIPRVRVAVSVDGLPEHHDPRRAPATYNRILQNIEDTRVNIHWTITRAMADRDDYADEYLAFWSRRPEVVRIWVSLYTPQKGEVSDEMLTAAQRIRIAGQLVTMKNRYPKLLFNEGIAGAILSPPKNPGECMFARMSTNYSADLATRVEPCVFGGDPDCSQCGCASSIGLHWLKELGIGPVKIKHLAYGSAAVGSVVGRLRKGYKPQPRWRPALASELVQIEERKVG